MSLHRIKQAGIKLEGTEATQETLAATDFQGEYKCSFNYVAPAYTRETDRASLSKRPQLRGPRLLEIKWESFEMAGGGAAAAASAHWHRMFRAAGMATTQLKVVTVAAPSGGSFRHGDALGNNATQGSATKTGTFVYYSSTLGKLWYVPGTGTLTDSETVYNYADPQVSAAVDSAPADGGQRLSLVSESDSTVPVSASAELRCAGQRHQIVGGRGDVTIRCVHGSPMMFDATLRGPCQMHADGYPEEASLHTGITASVAPVVVPKVGSSFLLDAHSPVVTDLTIAMNNQLTDRPNINASVEDSGYMATRIGDRAPSATIDPEHVARATYDWIGNFIRGDAARFYLAAGSPSGTSGLIIIGAPAATMQGDGFEHSERGGIRTNNVTLDLTGTTDDEFVIDHVFA